MAKNNETERTMTVLLSNGEMVKIKFCGDYWDDVYEDLKNSCDNGLLFNEGGWGNLHMTYRGIPINILNCRNVIGWNY